MEGNEETKEGREGRRRVDARRVDGRGGEKRRKMEGERKRMERERRRIEGERKGGRWKMEGEGGEERRERGRERRKAILLA